MNPMIFYLWFSLLSVTAAGEVLDACLLWRIATPFARRMAFFMLGFMLAEVVASVAVFFWWDPQCLIDARYSTAQIVRQLLECMSVGFLTYYLNGFFNRQRAQLRQSE